MGRYAFIVQFAAAILLAGLWPAGAQAGVNGSGEQSLIATGAAPKADQLLPCPLSVPCRASAPRPSMNAAGSRESRFAAVALPCPESIPCVAVDSRPLSKQFPSVAPRRHSRGNDRARTTRRPRATASKLKNTTRAPLDADSGRALTRSATTPDISLTNSGVTRDRALQSLTEANHRLASAEATGVRPQDTRTYDQAVAIQRMAQAAMQKHDYVAAQALGKKAARIVAVIKPQ